MLKKYEERTVKNPSPLTVAAVSPLDETEIDDLENSLHTTLVQTQTWKEVLLCPGLTADREQVADLLSTYHDIFSDLPGKTDVLECRLK